MPGEGEDQWKKGTASSCAVIEPLADIPSVDGIAEWSEEIAWLNDTHLYTKPF